MTEKDPGSSGGSNPQPETIKVEVDGEERTLSTEDVKNIIAQQKSATQKTQEVAKILEAVNRYGTTVDQFLDNAVGSFELMGKLMETGLIDEQGNVLEKKAGEPPPGGDQKSELEKLLEIKKASGVNPQGLSEKQLAVALKGLIEPVVSKIEKLEEDSVTLMKLRLSDQIQGKFENLSEADIAKVFSLAERDRTKSVMQHAEEVSKAKAEELSSMEKAWAEKYGVDPEKIKEKQLFEQDPASGAATMFKGKEISFKKKEGAVSPKQAAKEFFNKFDGFKL